MWCFSPAKQLPVQSLQRQFAAKMWQHIFLYFSSLPLRSVTPFTVQSGNMFPSKWQGGILPRVLVPSTNLQDFAKGKADYVYLTTVLTSRQCSSLQGHSWLAFSSFFLLLLTYASRTADMLASKLIFHACQWIPWLPPLWLHSRFLKSTIKFSFLKMWWSEVDTMIKILPKVYTEVIGQAFHDLNLRVIPHCCSTFLFICTRYLPFCILYLISFS